MSAHPIPDVALEADIAILGKKGRGKTYTAKGCVERLLDMGRRVIVLDPLSTWWGLKAGPNAYPIAILGGPHADLPIADSDGEALGRFFATSTQSAVIDLGAMRKAEMVRFAQPFLEELYTGNRGPLWLVLEEADVFAPQQPQPDTARLLGEVDRIARRGRQFGFRLITMTQRPARLNKDVLTQLSTLVALGITSPQDREAVKAWVEGNANRDKAKVVVDSLASLKVGDGWVWAPDLDLLERVKFPPIRTLDTSATPKAGEKRRDAVIKKDVDVGAIRSVLAAKPAQPPDQPKGAVAADTKAIEAAAEKRGHERGFQKGRSAGWLEAIALMQGKLGELAGQEIPAGSPALCPLPKKAVEGRQIAKAPTRQTDGAGAPATVASVAGPTVELPMTRRIIDAVHNAYPLSLTFNVAAMRAGASRRSSQFSTYRRQVEASVEIVVLPDARLRSADGFGQSGEPGADPVELFASRLTPSWGNMLRAIAKAERPLTRTEVATAANVSETSSGLGAGLAELAALGLVQRVQDGRFAPTAELVPP